MKNYPVPKSDCQVEHEVKKSRFIARVAKVESREQAMAFLEQAKIDYPDARHHCWAYLLGNPSSAASAAMSDDGEPSGTAGKPILNVLQHKGVGDVMVVVIRYFGGIKLGAGGLVRAYSAAAQLAMENVETVEHEAMQKLEVAVDFAQEQILRHWLSTHRAIIHEHNYTAQAVELTVSLPVDFIEDWKSYAAGQRIESRMVD